MSCEPAPMTKAPPWIQTITGRRAPSVAGVQTLRKRQSSSIGASSNPIMPSALAFCIACARNRVASRMSALAGGGEGARKRRGALGGAGREMPRNTVTCSSRVPRIWPKEVVTTGSIRPWYHGPSGRGELKRGLMGRQDTQRRDAGHAGEDRRAMVRGHTRPSFSALHLAIDRPGQSMVKLVFCLRRPAHLPAAAVHRYWRDEHRTPLAPPPPPPRLLP